MKKLFILILLFSLIGCNNTKNVTENDNINENMNSIQTNNEDIIKDYSETLGVGINQNNFPDKEFIQYIKDNIDIDNNNYLSNEEIMNTTIIHFKDNISLESLKGIEYFKYLEELTCWKCEKLMYVDISDLNNLKSLWLEYVPICDIDLSNNLKIEDLGFNNTNMDIINIHGSSNKIKVYIAQSNLNTKVDISNCQYLKNDLYNALYGKFDAGLYIETELIGDNFIDVVCDGKIIEHATGSSDLLDVSNLYTLGQGTNDTINNTFDTFEDAYNYGFNGNKWFNIIEHKYKEGLSEEESFEACYLPRGDCTYQYEVIVYDEQSF